MNAKQYVYVICGILCVALGALGVVVPGLPTTPFLLLASWLFYRSSPRLQAWLLNSWLGKYIRSYEENRGLTLRKKICIVALMAAMCSFSIFFCVEKFIIRCVIAGAGLIGLFVVLFVVPTIPHTKK